MLFAAARADHVEPVIRPALEAGQWVLSDRFYDSTRVYQAAADPSFLDALDRVAVGSTRPDLTVILDIPADVGMARAADRMAATGTTPDRFERDAIALHERRRQAFLKIAAEPQSAAPWSMRPGPRQKSPSHLAGGGGAPHPRRGARTGLMAAAGARRCRASMWSRTGRRRRSGPSGSATRPASAPCSTPIAADACTMPG